MKEVTISWKRRFGLVAAIAAVSLLTACAATGPQFSGIATPAADKGDVYLYRTSAFAAGGAEFAVSLDEKKIDSIPNAAFLHLRLEPGKHTLQVKPSWPAKASELTIDVEAAKTKFYRYEFVTGLLFNSFFVGAAIEPKEEATALLEMKELKAAK